MDWARAYTEYEVADAGMRALVPVERFAISLQARRVDDIRRRFVQAQSEARRRFAAAMFGFPVSCFALGWIIRRSFTKAKSPSVDAAVSNASAEESKG